MMPEVFDNRTPVFGDHKRLISHEINNRMNAIMLAIGVLELHSDPNVRDIILSMKAEMQDLEQLIRIFKQNE